MESVLQKLTGECERPQHLRPHSWQDRHGRGLSVDLWFKVRTNALSPKINRKRAVRLARKWSCELLPLQQPVVSQKLLEAMMNKFTAEGKRERIARALAALNRPPSIQLPLDEWRQITENPDLEDQF